MTKICFAVAAYNLAEVSRMVEIAKKAREVFDVEFIHYGGKYEYIIKEEGFKVFPMEPALTERQLTHIGKMLNGDALNPVAYFNEKEIRTRVKSEIAYFMEAEPAAVITGWNLTVGISARYVGVHYVNVLHSTSVREYYEAGLQSYPDNLDNWLLDKLMPPEKRTALFNKRVLNASIPMKPYNKVLKDYELAGFRNFVEFIEGDTTLLADIPEWVNHRTLRNNLRHIGPLPARLNIPVPEELKNLKGDTPIVYFAMGSSGKKELIGNILAGFKGKPYRVIAPIKSLIEGLDIVVPENVIVTEFLPAHIVNKMADVAVIHGGQNTVMNACLSGTPMVGIGMHVEQQANLDACVRKGFAIRLSKKRVTPSQIIESIESLLSNQEAKSRINQFRQQLEAWDGPANAVKVLQEVIYEKANQ